MSQEILEQRFSVRTPAHLTVSNICGSIVVYRGEDDSAIEVNAVKHTLSGDADRTRIEITQASEDRVKVITHYDKYELLDLIFFWWNRQPCKVDYIIKVPRHCSVTIKGVSCPASLSGLEGAFEVKTVSGEISVTDLTGQLSASSVSGGIVGEKITGPVLLDSISGKMRMLDSRLPSIHASTLSGRLAFETPMLAGPYRFKTVSGDCELTLSEAAACVVDAKSISGRFKSDLQLPRRQLADQPNVVEFGDGGPEVHFRSTSGDLRISGVPGEAAIPIETQPTDVRKVLERIARGELSPEEGLAAMKVGEA